MAPIKIKLSLSSASLVSNPNPSSDTSTSALDKGKGKEGSSTPLSSHVPPQDTQPPYAPYTPTGQSDTPEAGPSSTPSYSPYNPVPVASKPSRSISVKTKTRGKVKSKLGRIPKPKPKARESVSAPARPTAIPPHVYSTPGPSTPVSSPGHMGPPAYPFPAVSTPSPAPDSRWTSQPSTPVDEVDVKMEEEGSPDPLAGTMEDPQGEAGTPVVRGRGLKWARSKKPLKELLGKLMIELRRRDEYALFSEPVNTDEFPTYLTTIGGEDQMMDLSTMQNKIDNNEYRTIDEAESDLRLLASAAQKFNPPGSVPYRSATNILTHGLKQIEKARPLVMTPSPSPTRPSHTPTGTPLRFGSTDPLDLDPKIEIPPEKRIPIEMLQYPPKSLEGLAVGWNLNGGKRVYIKRELRARERFNGKWRHSDLDGTRSLVEMEDIDQVLQLGKRKRPREILDWRGMRKEEYWDWPGYGGPFGQPPVPFTKYPIRPSAKYRSVGMMEYGLYPEIEAERHMFVQRLGRGLGIVDEVTDIMSEHLRPTISRSAAAAAAAARAKAGPAAQASGLNGGYLNLYEARPEREWMRDMEDGDVRGEAYRTSIKRFMKGVISGSRAEGEEGNAREGLDELERYIQEEYNGGVIRSPIQDIISNTLLSLKQLDPTSSDSLPTSATSLIPPDTLRQILQTSHARTTMRHLLRPSNPLDISPFIHAPEEFVINGRYAGLGEKLRWTAQELERMLRLAEDKRQKEQGMKGMELDENVKGVNGGFGGLASDTSDPSSGSGKSVVRAEAVSDINTTSPITGSTTIPALPAQTASSTKSETDLEPGTQQARPKPEPEQPTVEDDEGGLKSLRLEILTICKFFPLTGLKPLKKSLADRVLPVNVRGLLTAPE